MEESIIYTKCTICNKPTCGCRTCQLVPGTSICTECSDKIVREHNIKQTKEKPNDARLFSKRHEPTPLSRVKEDAPS